MRVLILGGEGMLGHKMYQVLNDQFETHVTFRRVDGPWRTYPVYENLEPENSQGGVDALELKTVSQSLESVKPDVVVNCIGIIKQVKEANDPITSLKINSLFPHQLADLCGKLNTRLIHFSTDCVFSGKKGSYLEDDFADADDLYGRTKFLGELNREGCLTIRTSLFGRDFIKKTALLEWFLSNRGGTINGYVNAIFSGFPTQILSGIVRDLIKDYPGLSGLYHISSAPISKYDLLMKINDALDIDVNIEPYTDYVCDRSLDSSKFKSETGYAIPDWDTMISILAEDQTPYDQWRNTNNETI
jgi:dTDP-4-dehydrorhamnose reductase